MQVPRVFALRGDSGGGGGRRRAGEAFVLKLNQVLRKREVAIERVPRALFRVARSTPVRGIVPRVGGPTNLRPGPSRVPERFRRRLRASSARRRFSSREVVLGSNSRRPRPSRREVERCPRGSPSCTASRLRRNQPPRVPRRFGTPPPRRVRGRPTVASGLPRRADTRTAGVADAVAAAFSPRDSTAASNLDRRCLLCTRVTLVTRNPVGRFPGRPSERCRPRRIDRRPTLRSFETTRPSVFPPRVGRFPQSRAPPSRGERAPRTGDGRSPRTPRTRGAPRSTRRSVKKPPPPVERVSNEERERATRRTRSRRRSPSRVRRSDRRTRTTTKLPSEAPSFASSFASTFAPLLLRLLLRLLRLRLPRLLRPPLPPLPRSPRLRRPFLLRVFDLASRLSDSTRYRRERAFDDGDGGVATALRRFRRGGGVLRIDFAFML